MHTSCILEDSIVNKCSLVKWTRDNRGRKTNEKRQSNIMSMSSQGRGRAFQLEGDESICPLSVFEYSLTLP